MRFLKYDDLKPEKGIPYSRTHLDRLEKLGKFPRRTRFSKNGMVFWSEDAIDQYLTELAHSTDPP